METETIVEPRPSRAGMESQTAISPGLLGLLVLMSFLWAISFPIGKIVMRDLPPALLPGLRVTLAGLLLVPVFLWDARRRPPLRMDWFDRGQFILMALFGIALNQILFLSGLKRTSVAHAAVVIALTPIQILLMSVILGRERFSFFRLAGMGIALCGVAVMQTSKGTATLAGDLLVLAAGFTFAIFTIISKPLTTRFGSLPTTSLLYWAAAGLLLPLTVYEARGFDFRGVPLVAWLLVAYLAAFPSVLCYLIWYHALGKLGASRVAMFSYLQPLFATLSAIPLIGEAAGWAVAVGGVLVLGGVALAEKR